jgi:arabinose-5-phosphate isomerase
VAQEACPLGLAPTSSTTAALVMGDALAIALLEARGFTADDFARSHPAGSLGRRLLLLVDDVMHKQDEIPSIGDSAKLTEALMEMTQKGLGMTLVHDADQRVCGIYTDGDLRRTLDLGDDLRDIAISECMTPSFKYASPGMLAAEALRMMQTNKFSSLPVLDDDGRAVGALNMHDLLRAGVV